MRGRHRAPRISAETRERRRLRVRRGFSILAVTLLATIPVGVSAAMVPQRTVNLASADAVEVPTPSVDRVSDFDVVDGRRAAAAKTVDGTVAAAGLSATAMGVGVKTAATVDTSCGAGLGAGAALAPPSVCAVTEPAGMNWSVFDPGNIISDEVFYNTGAMTRRSDPAFIADPGRRLHGAVVPEEPAGHHAGAAGGSVLRGLRRGRERGRGGGPLEVSRACGINPQVMLVTLQKESGLLTRRTRPRRRMPRRGGGTARTPAPAAPRTATRRMRGSSTRPTAWPTNGPGTGLRPEQVQLPRRSDGEHPVECRRVRVRRSACDDREPGHRVAVHLHAVPAERRVAGRLPGGGRRLLGLREPELLLPVPELLRVHRRRHARPAAAQPVHCGVAGHRYGGDGIPANQFVSAALGGQMITAPTAAVAAGLAAGFAALGLPYVWGGGGSGAGPNNGCARGGGELNSCGTEIGFDCSGLTAFVLGRAGFGIPGDSSSDRAVGTAQLGPGTAR